MEIIFGENQEGKIKFSKKIGEKTYFYNGNLDKVGFIEDIIFNVVEDNNKELSKNNFCSITSINNERYIISFFNDISDEKPKGEQSLEYTLKDFSEEEIKNYINHVLTEQNYTDDNIVLLTIENGIYTFNNIIKDSEEEIVIKEQELNYETMISGYKKYSKIYVYIIVIFLIITTGYILHDKYSKENNAKIKVLETQQKTTEKKKKDLEREILEEKIKFNKLEVKKHLLEPANLKELDQKIYDLKLPESLKDNK